VGDLGGGGEVGLAPQVVLRVIVVVVRVRGGLISMRATNDIAVGGYGCVWYVSVVWLYGGFVGLVSFGSFVGFVVFVIVIVIVVVIVIVIVGGFVGGCVCVCMYVCM